MLDDLLTNPMCSYDRMMVQDVISGMMKPELRVTEFDVPETMTGPEMNSGPQTMTGSETE